MQQQGQSPQAARFGAKARVAVTYAEGLVAADSRQILTTAI